MSSSRRGNYKTSAISRGYWGSSWKRGSWRLHSDFNDFKGASDNCANCATDSTSRKVLIKKSLSRIANASFNIYRASILHEHENRNTKMSSFFLNKLRKSVSQICLLLKVKDTKEEKNLKMRTLQQRNELDSRPSQLVIWMFHLKIKIKIKTQCKQRKKEDNTNTLLYSPVFQETIDIIHFHLKEKYKKRMQTKSRHLFGPLSENVSKMHMIYA